MVIIPLKGAREKYAMQIRKIYLKFILVPWPRNFFFFSYFLFFFFFRFPFTWRIIASRCHEAERKSRSTEQRDEKFPEIYYREQSRAGEGKREGDSGLKPRKVMPNQSPRCSITIEGARSPIHVQPNNKKVFHTRV